MGSWWIVTLSTPLGGGAKESTTRDEFALHNGGGREDAAYGKHKEIFLSDSQARVQLSCEHTTERARDAPPPGSECHGNGGWAALQGDLRMVCFGLSFF